MAAGLAAGLAAGPASAQQLVVIPPDVRTASSMTAAHRQVINEFVDQRAPSLSLLDPDLRQRDRDAILRELESPSASPAFMREFSQALLPKVRDMAAAGNDLSTQLNAMIVLSEIPSPEAVAFLIDPAQLAHENPAIRYWAAQGVSNAVTRQEGLLGGQRRAMEQAILDRLAVETSTETAKHLFQALAPMQQPPAMLPLAEALGARVALHAANPSLSHLDTREAVRQSRVQLSILAQLGQDVAPIRNELAKAAFGHAEVIAGQLADANVQLDQATRVAHAATLRIIHESLVIWWREAGGPANARPQNDAVLNPIQFGNWGQLPAAFAQWRQSLSAAGNPFGLTAEDL